MRNVAIGIGCFIGFFAVVFVIGFIAQGTDFVLYKTFAPARANVERQVFENTNSYVRGMNAEIQDFAMEYARSTTDQEHKDAIAIMVLEKVANFPEDQMVPTVRKFVRQLKMERGLLLE